MTITGPQSKAARALVEWPRDHVARLSGLTVDTLRRFEVSKIHPGDEALGRLRATLESGGAVFIDEDLLGAGVRLKFTRKEVRSIHRLENEGGPFGDDDV